MGIARRRGRAWVKLNDFVVQDPEYYGEIYADPFQFDRVYAMDVAVRVTEDGGKDDYGGRLGGARR